MKAVLLLVDTLTRKFLPNYGDDETVAPNFARLGERTMTFDDFYGCSLPCMPARREMHTGRPNFLHRGWSPLEPFDESVIADLKRYGVYTHMVTDHYHYWEIGGYGYLNQYDSFEIVRGQQGDLWRPHVGDIEYPRTLSNRVGTDNYLHDFINRQEVNTSADLPTTKVFDEGVDYLRRFHAEGNWFLTIESFSPHEPFLTTEEYLELYEDNYDGPLMDWPDYGENTLEDKPTEHLQMRFRAMVSMVDQNLGRVLDVFDELDLWEDTALILYTSSKSLLVRIRNGSIKTV